MLPVKAEREEESQCDDFIEPMGITVAGTPQKIFTLTANETNTNGKLIHRSIP